MNNKHRPYKLLSCLRTRLLRGVIASFTASLSLISVSPIQADIIVGPSDADITIKRIKAAYFLTQATMGATHVEIKQLANQITKLGEEEAFETWIDKQFNMNHVPKLEHALTMVEKDGFEHNSTKATHPNLDLSIWHYRYYTWWDQALNHNDQLHQRMTWALSQIFIANAKTTSVGWAAPLNHYDGLGQHAFGNYRDLLEFITYSPVMGEFLGAAHNDKGDPDLGVFPDENYAREIMQLFSIGVYEVNWRGRLQYEGDFDPIENYTNEDIIELAKVMTGLAPVPRTSGMNFFNTIGESKDIPMMMWEDHHYQGEKTFLGHTIPAGQTGDEDISQALDVLFNHPCTAPFIARRLIQRFTDSTPSTGHIGRVAKAFEDNGSGVRGDFKAVLRAILLDRDARALDISTTTLADGKVLISVDSANNLSGRLREPALLMAHFLRYFELESLENQTEDFTGYFKPEHTLKQYTNQDIGGNDSVFNYYSADYLPTSGPAANKIRNGSPLVLPEFELLPRSGVSMNEGIQLFSKDMTVPQRATIFSEPASLNRLSAIYDEYESSGSFEDLVDELNLYMFYGSMPDELRTELLDTLGGLTSSLSHVRFGNAVAILLNSADFAVVY